MTWNGPEPTDQLDESGSPNDGAARDLDADFRELSSDIAHLDSLRGLAETTVLTFRPLARDHSIFQHSLDGWTNVSSPVRQL